MSQQFDTRTTPSAPLINIGATIAITIAITAAVTVLSAMFGGFGVGTSAPQTRMMSLPVMLHLATVVPALLLGPVVLLRRKGDATHRMLGRIWAVLMLVTAILIKLESPGPVMFLQNRVGKGNQDFRIYKFRSMVLNADQALEDWKLSHPDLWHEYVRNNFKLASDPRVTPIGRLIRRTSIDELPQLINVFKGDMSLVGPRPLLARELDAYGRSIDVYTNVRPGISGLWQISGRSSTTFDARIALDRWYFRNWSFWNDLVILIRTVKVVLRSDGAH